MKCLSVIPVSDIEDQTWLHEAKWKSSSNISHRKSPPWLLNPLTGSVLFNYSTKGTNQP